MKKNILPIVLLALLSVFAVFFGYSTYVYYQAIHSDDPIVPYLLVNSGSATIVRGELAIDMVRGDQYDLEEKDIIITKKETFATVYWPDRSTTRIGAESRMILDRMYANDDYSEIELAYSLEQGKVWNTVVRTLYPNSYFTVKLPKAGGTIAGVRGTIFEINLDRDYIHSVDHGVALSDARGQAITLLPGELVQATNILKKLTTATLDRAWGEYNKLQDATYSLLRSTSIQKTVDLLSGSGDTSVWHDLVRRILSWFPTFADIRVLESIQSASSFDPNAVSVEQVMKWYNHFQDTKFVQEREKIRTLLEKQMSYSGSSQYLDVLARGAIWDSLSFTGMDLDSTTRYMKLYTQDMDKKIQSVLNIVPTADLQNKARETLRTLIGK